MTTRKTETNSRPARKSRKPINSKNLLRAEQRPGFVRRYVNDVDTRIQMFLEAGYEPVKGQDNINDYRAQDGSQLGSVVRKPVGGGVTAVLMEIPEEFYKEDQISKQAEVDAHEQAIGLTAAISRGGL